MQAVLKKYITMDKDILGGTPVISGTRIPVERLSYLIKSGYSEEKIMDEYPHVGVKKIQALLAYLVLIGLNAFKQNQKKPSVR